jgi:hypothetical protein
VAALNSEFETVLAGLSQESSNAVFYAQSVEVILMQKIK